jgi:hypothetical protein
VVAHQYALAIALHITQFLMFMHVAFTLQPAILDTQLELYLTTEIRRRLEALMAMV